MLTLFLNAVTQIVQKHGEKKTMPQVDVLLEYLPKPNIKAMLRPSNADATRLWDARALFMDVNKWFQEYMVLYDFDQASTESGTVRKPKHSIVEPWPMRLKLEKGQSGSLEEFRLLLGSRSTGLEHYVEWVRGQ